jgi:uncharacterized protein (UPF0254 family)
VYSKASEPADGKVSGLYTRSLRSKTICMLSLGTEATAERESTRVVSHLCQFVTSNVKTLVLVNKMMIMLLRLVDCYIITILFNG